MSRIFDIRAAAQSDAARWLELFNAYLAFYEADPKSVDDEALWSRILDESDPISCHVAVFDGDLAGFTHFFPHPDTWERDDVCYLEDLYVDPPFRRSGVAELLIASVVDVARDRGWPRVYWQTADDNVAARSLYDKLTGGRASFVLYELSASS